LIFSEVQSTTTADSDNPDAEDSTIPPMPKKTLAQVHAECFEKLKDLNLKCSDGNDDFDSDDFDLDGTDDSEEDM
jgi:hypothetical protein